MDPRFYRLIDRVQLIGLAIVIAVVPLVFYVGNQNIVLLKPLLAQFVVFVLFGLWMVEATERGSFELVPTALNGLLVTYLLWLVVTVLFASEFWYFSLEELGRYLCVILLFFLVQKIVRTRFRLKLMLWVLAATSFLATTYGYLQYVDMGFIEWGQSVLIASFGNKNFFVGYLVLTTPVLFGALLAFRKLPYRILLGGLGLFQGYMVLVTGTRTGFLGLLIGGLLFLVLFAFYHWRRRSPDRRQTEILGVLAAMLVGGIVAYGIVPSHLVRRMGEAFDLQQGTGRVRWIMWTGSSRAAEDAPWLGHGHGVFQQVFPNYRPTFYHRFRVSHNTRHSHNEYLEVLMETGTVGLALFLLLFVVTGMVVYRYLNRAGGGFYPYLVIGLTGGVTGSLGQNFASVNLRWMSTTLTFWFILGLLFTVIRLGCKDTDGRADDSGVGGSAPVRKIPLTVGRGLIHGLIVLCLVASGYGFFRLYRADRWLNTLNGYLGIASRQRGYWRLAAQAGNTSLSYNAYSLSTRYKLGYVYLNQGRYRKAREVYDSLTDLAPNYAQIHNNIAIIHGQANRPYHSVLHFEWATLLEDNVRNHFNLAGRYQKLGRRDRAFYHVLFVPRIHLEEIRNEVHVQTIKLGDRNFKRAKRRIQNRRESRSNQRRALTFLRATAPGDQVDLHEYYGLRMALHGDGSERVLRRLSGEERPLPSGLVLLGLAGRWRGVTTETANSRRRQLIERLESATSLRDPLSSLALAELYAQRDRSNRAREVLRRVRDRLPIHSRVRESIRYVEGSSGNPGTSQSFRRLHTPRSSARQRRGGP